MMGSKARARRRCLIPFLSLFLVACLLQSSSAGVTKNNSCKKVGVEELIDEEGCDLMIIRINRCSGHCFSFTFPNPLTKKYSVHAKCCRMVEWEMLETELKCSEGSRKLRIPSATQCECFDCLVQ
uniref:Bursicon n=1 Tax=Caenorhabditis tropicalis TaxID=1561998 RepID=A0A1I7UBX9_9PELO